MWKEGVTSDITEQNCPNILLEPLCSFSQFPECWDSVYLIPHPNPLCWIFSVSQTAGTQRYREPPVSLCSPLNHLHLSLALLANRDIKPTSRPPLECGAFTEGGRHGLAWLPIDSYISPFHGLPMSSGHILLPDFPASPGPLLVPVLVMMLSNQCLLNSLHPLPSQPIPSIFSIQFPASSAHTGVLIPII